MLQPKLLDYGLFYISLGKSAILQRLAKTLMAGDNGNTGQENNEMVSSRFSLSGSKY